MAGIAAGSSVWVRGGPKEEVFSPAVVQSYERGKGYMVRMSLAGESGERLVRPADVSLANDVASAADSCALIHINEATILHNLRARYEDQSIYSYVGAILIAVNPFQSLPIYGAPLMEEYAGKPLGAAEPHVYALAEEAYRSFVRTKGSQSLVVSGESGSGKTETNKHLMAYLAWRSKSESVGGDLAERILMANPLLEAFGNAKTSRNNNSSRFGKFVKVGLSERGSVLGATTKQYLLEKSRVPYQAPGERNYHIFYAAVAAAAHPDLACLGLDGGPSGFHYLNQSGTLEAPGWDDGAAFEVVRAALASVGAEPQTVREVFRVIAGLLHLGNVRFEGDEAASVEPATSASLDKAAELLGLPRLGSLLLARTLVTRGETTRVELTPERAALARDALAKATYARLFERTIGWINRATRAEGGEAAPPAFIGLLDVYGFEAFETNAFEQLSINFANEKLQQFFLRFVFKAEEELYAAEGVRRPDVEYQDNSRCIALIEQSPSGLLRLLDETCKRPNATDKSFCEAAAATHASNDFFVEPRLAGRRDLRSDEGFCVRHFAGDVVYTGRGFVEKNNDTLHADFTELLAASGVGLVKDLFDVGAASGRKGQSFNSVSRRFINDLNELAPDRLTSDSTARSSPHPSPRSAHRLRT